MKIMILAGDDSVIGRSFESGFMKNNEICYFDFNKYIKGSIRYLEQFSNYMSRKFRDRIRNNYLDVIQKGYISDISGFNPDLIIVYNDQMVSRETVSYIRKSKIKLAVYLADNPFFLVRRDHIMDLLINADQIFAADSYWLQSLNAIGIMNTSFFVPGYDVKTYYLLDESQSRRDVTQEIVYIGSTYMNLWGYKRALFLSKFTGMNFRFYGPSNWNMWFKDFPELESHFQNNLVRLPDDQVNQLLNKSLIYPVDANPGIINGFHIRVLESISCGVLPLVEDKKDIHTVFKDLEIPVIKNYDNARELARYYIKNEGKRESIVKSLREFITENYLPEHTSSVLLGKLLN